MSGAAPTVVSPARTPPADRGSHGALVRAGERAVHRPSQPIGRLSDHAARLPDGWGSIRRSLPAAVTATSGLNALAHCVAALYRVPANPIAALAAEAGIGSLAPGLPAAVADGADLAARSELMYGSCLAGSALAAAGTGLHHAICHALGGVCGLSHGETHAVLLPRVVAYLEPRHPDASARIADLLGARIASEGLAALAAQVDAPRDLTALGMRPADVDAVVDAVLAGDHPIERSELQHLLHTALGGSSTPGA